MKRFLKSGLAFLVCVTILPYSIMASAEGLEFSEKDDIQVQNVEAVIEEVEVDLKLDEPDEKQIDMTKVDAPEDDCVIDENGKLIAYYGSSTDVVLPEGVLSVGTVFRRNSKIVSIVLPKGMDTIGEDDFKGCSSLKKVTFPTTLEYIAPYAFSGCSSLEKVDLTNTKLECIADNAFEECDSLKKVLLPDTDLRIYQDAFWFCGNLTEFRTGKKTNFTEDPFYYSPGDYPKLVVYGYDGTNVKQFCKDNGIPYKKTNESTTGGDPTKVKLNKAGKISLKKNKKLTLKATLEPADATSKMTWTSSDPEVASVSSKGVVKGLKEGTAKITCAAQNDKSDSVTILVNKVATMDKPTVKRESNNSVIVSWKPLNGVDGYQIYVYDEDKTDVPFSYVKPLTIKGGNKKKAVVYVKPGEKLYYFVRGFLGKAEIVEKGYGGITGKWSKAKSFKLERKEDAHTEVKGKTFLGSKKIGNVKYTVELLDWNYNRSTTTITTRVTFEWTKCPNPCGKDILSMGVSGDLTEVKSKAVLEYVPWRYHTGSLTEKEGGFSTEKPVVEVSGKTDGVYIEINPQKYLLTYSYGTRTKNKARKESIYSYATYGSITTTWSASGLPKLDFAVFASYGDNQAEIEVKPSVSFDGGIPKVSVKASIEEHFKEGPLAKAKVNLDYD